MRSMSTDHSLADLAQLAGVTPRTIRYYIAQGLLPSPGQVGPGARYGEAHLARLRLIRRLQRDHQPLAAIRARLAVLSDDDVARLTGDAAAEPTPTSTALEYVRDLLRGAPGTSVMPASLRAMTVSTMPLISLRASLPVAAAFAAPATRAPATPAPAPRVAEPQSAPPAAAVVPIGPGPFPPAGPLRSQWERIAFGPDVEIHVRRPLGPGDVRRLERLVAFARQLFEEDQP